MLSKPQNKRPEALFHFASRKSVPNLEGLQDVLTEQLLVSVRARFVIVPIDVIGDCSDYDVGNLERLNVARVAEGCSPNSPILVASFFRDSARHDCSKFTSWALGGSFVGIYVPQTAFVAAGDA